jgi:hypothetical protein
VVAFKIPTESGVDRSIFIGNGALFALDEYVCNNLPPQGIPLSNSHISDDSEEQPVHSDQTICTDTRIIKWSSKYIAWLSPIVVEKLREMGHSREHLLFESWRVVQPKFVNAVDSNLQKIKAKGSIDLGLVSYPNIIGVRGRFHIEQVEVELPSDGKKKPLDIYRSIGTTLGLKIIFSSPLVSKSIYQEVTKSVHDYIPKAKCSPEIAAQRKTLFAQTQYSKKVKDITLRLVNEYKESILTGNVDALTRNQTHSSQDEQQRKKLFAFHLNKSGAYYSFKEELKSSVVQIVREVIEN